MFPGYIHVAACHEVMLVGSYPGSSVIWSQMVGIFVCLHQQYSETCFKRPCVGHEWSLNRGNHLDKLNGNAAIEM